VHLVITDSGLGGLSICAAIARARARTDTRLTYVNAWPERGRGYNDLPDMAARARVFDRALDAFGRLEPDQLVIACNTLSIVYGFTAFRAAASFPVRGIIESGVDLFREKLADEPASSLLLLGTRTTIDSGVHRQRLIESGISPQRLAAQSCHGLAAAIERAPASTETDRIIDECSLRASQVAVAAEPSFVGLCCTHYALVSDQICRALTRQTGRTMVPLDPNQRMVDDVLRSSPAAPPGRISVQVISKVAIEDSSREAMATVLQPVSPETAAALRSYSHVEDLF
jgi:glutamate racemase